MGQRGRGGEWESGRGGRVGLVPRPLAPSPPVLRPPNGQAFARVEDTGGLDIINHFAFLAQFVHGPGHADPGHELLLSGVFDLTYRDVFPFSVSALTNLLCPQPVSLDVGP